MAVALEEELEEAQEEEEAAKAHEKANEKTQETPKATGTGKNVVNSIKRIHDSAKSHPAYATLRSPVDRIFISDKFNANNIHAYDIAALVPLAQQQGHFDHDDEEMVAESLAWQEMVLWARHEHSGFAQWEKILREDLAEQRRLFEKYGLVQSSAPKFWEVNATNETTPTLHDELKRQQMLLMANGLKDHNNRLQKKYDELTAKTVKHERVLPDDIEEKWHAQWPASGLLGKQNGKRMNRPFKVNIEPVETELELEEHETQHAEAEETNKHVPSRRLLNVKEDAEEEDDDEDIYVPGKDALLTKKDAQHHV